MKDFIEEGRLKNAPDYEEFIRKLEKKIENNGNDDRLRLSYARMKRIYSNHKLSDETKKILSALNRPVTLMVITEDWCGDSAQTLPYFAVTAAASDEISLKIIERDANPDIMDQYLTNGTRSIPKMVAFDESGNELFQWGPRPAYAAELVKKKKAQGIPKEEFIADLHRWYAKDKGSEIEKEIAAMLANI